MKIAVVGLGGVGGYIAACLARAQYDVVGFARKEHLREIEKNGIEIVEDTTSWRQTLNVQPLEEATGDFDIALFCVKSYDLQTSYTQLQHTLHPHSVVLSFSNGVNNGDILRKLSTSKVLDGAIYILSHIEKAGVIRKKGKVFAAVFGGDKEATRKLSEVFENAQLRHKTPENITHALWKKYIFNSAFATLTSYYDCSIGEVYEKHQQEAKKLLEEIAQVAVLYGVDVSDEVAKSLQTASTVPYDSTTSMHKDFQQKKRDELESLSGFISKTKEVPTPLMDRFYKALKQKM